MLVNKYEMSYVGVEEVLLGGGRVFAN